MTFIEKLEARQRKVNSLLCAGLDSDYEKIPECVKAPWRPSRRDFIPGVMIEFCQKIVDATHIYVCAYKINVAFFEAWGDEGYTVLQEVVRYIRVSYPNIPIIFDGKRGDIGNTNKGYAEFAFDVLAADAITVPPYLGEESLRSFLDRKDKGVIVLCRTSNPGAGEFQDMPVTINGIEKPLYQWVAYNVVTKWNKNGNCLLVVGATYPEELKQVRKIVDDMPILVPGVGAQGGDLKLVLQNGLASNGLELIINMSRNLIFASSGEDFAEASASEAAKMRILINQYRQEVLQ